MAGHTIDPSSPVPGNGSSREEEEDRPDWPPPDIEAAMSAEAADRDGGDGRAPTSRRVREARETLDGPPLPALDEIIGQIPPETKEQLEELFRAKFTEVRRVPAAVFKDYEDPAKAAAKAAAEADEAGETEDPGEDSSDDD